MISKLYYEAHVTIEPIEDEDLLAKVKRVSETLGFRVADLFMLKNRQETPERSNRDTFMTGHGKELKDIQSRTVVLVQSLQSMDIKVWRYKIEDTILDSRTEDVFGLLP